MPRLLLQSYATSRLTFASWSPGLWPCCLTEECFSSKECSSRRADWEPIGTQTGSHPHTHRHTHTQCHTQCTTLPTFIQLIFLAAISFNCSHSGPLPWPSADERAHSVLHYPLSFQHCRQWSWERTVKGYYRPDNWKMSRLQDFAAMPCGD